MVDVSGESQQKKEIMQKLEHLGIGNVWEG